MIKASLARATVILLFGLVLLPSAVFAQNGPFAIVRVDFKVQGRTQESALRRSLEAAGPLEGASFATKDELEAAVEARRQALADNRVFASVEASIEYAEREGGGGEAAVSFAVTDTNNIVVLPEPKYDSNAGLSLTLKGRDYNFLGSMRSLELDLGYTSESATSRYFSGQTNLVLPFRALGSEASFGLFEDALLWVDGSAAASASAASLAYEVPLGFPTSLKAIAGYADYEDGSSNAMASLVARADAPLGIQLGELGELHAAPILSYSFGRWPDGWDLFKAYDGASATARAALEAGRIRWVGNQQSGTIVRAIVSGSEFFARSDFLLEAELDYERHWVFGESWGIASRFVAIDRPVGSFPTDDFIDLGSYLRGIVDARISAASGAFLNLSAPVKLFDFPTHALIGKDILDFELQAAPFVDAAYILGSSDAGNDGSWATAGLELLVFPKAFRSFYLRASFGYDLLRASSSGSYGAYELYIGTDLFLDPAMTMTKYQEWLNKR